MVEAIEILPDLWMGNIESSINLGFQEENNITCLINGQNDLNFWGKSKEYNEPIKQNIIRYEVTKTCKYLMEVTEYINHNLKNNKVILVYCKNCIQISPTIILSYLIRYGEININTGIQIIRTKFSKAFQPNIDFSFALKQFYKNINY